MRYNTITDKLSKHLFWDVNRKTLDLEKNKAYIIKQVLEYGLIEDWAMIKKYYGLATIAHETKNLRELDKKALSFIATISKTPLVEFRCYNYQQSTPPHWNF